MAGPLGSEGYHTLPLRMILWRTWPTKVFATEEEKDEQMGEKKKGCPGSSVAAIPIHAT
jgi:hypothetical protein